MGDKPLFTPDEQKRRDKSNPVQSTSKGVEKQEVKKKTKSSTADRSRDPPKSQNLNDRMTRMESFMSASLQEKEQRQDGKFREIAKSMESLERDVHRIKEKKSQPQEKEEVKEPDGLETST